MRYTEHISHDLYLFLVVNFKRIISIYWEFGYFFSVLHELRIRIQMEDIYFHISIRTVNDVPLSILFLLTGNHTYMWLQRRLYRDKYKPNFQVHPFIPSNRTYDYIERKLRP